MLELAPKRLEPRWLRNDDDGDDDDDGFSLREGFQPPC